MFVYEREREKERKEEKKGKETERTSECECAHERDTKCVPMYTFTGITIWFVASNMKWKKPHMFSRRSKRSG